MRLSISRRAEADLDSIWTYIARQSNSFDTATRVITSILGTASLLCRSPKLGRNRESEARSNLRSIPAGNYLIFYRIKPGIIRIVRVLHGKRDTPEVLRRQ
jgi:toxin ParE1/3/4